MGGELGIGILMAIVVVVALRHSLSFATRCRLRYSFVRVGSSVLWKSIASSGLEELERPKRKETLTFLLWFISLDSCQITESRSSELSNLSRGL